jgi:segregation and condensation protein A
MEESRYHIRLEIFEGPLDLLYHLIQKNEVDIYDIPIARIADQYLEYIELLKSMNVDLAGDFLVMAATLLHIKSRMLLPRHEEDEQEEDPRMEIVRPLSEYIQIKEAADRMAARPVLGESVFAREPEPAPDFSEEDALISVGLFELIDAFAKILQKSSKDDLMKVSAETVSVRERITQIHDLLEQKQTVTFEELFEQNPTRGELVVTFLAILEMVKLALVRIAQHIQSGVMRIFYA